MEEHVLDEEKFQESLRTVAVYADEKVIWTSDNVVNGFYIVDKLTYEVKKILDSFQLLVQGVSHIASIFRWKDNIIMVPVNLSMPWVIYNVKSEKVQFKSIIKHNWRTTGLRIIGKNAFLAPTMSQDPVIIIDLDTFESIQIIENWNEELPESYKKGVESWLSVVADDALYFPLYNTSFIIKFSENKVDVYNIDIPYGICSIDVYEGIIWILPTKGDCIYATDLCGNIVDIIRLIVDNRLVFVDVFARIVSVENYIFLLPFSDIGIYVYDRVKKQIVVINTEEKTLKSLFPLKRNAITYWEYFVDKNAICFMPLGKKFLSINLDTLEWEERDIILPPERSSSDLKCWFVWNKFLSNNSVNWEEDERMFEIWLTFVKNIDCTHKIRKKQYGELIWNEINGNIGKH